jgi:hypothetical protein
MTWGQIVVGSIGAVAGLSSAIAFIMFRRRYSRRLAALFQARLQHLRWRLQQLPPGIVTARLAVRPPNPTARPALRTRDTSSPPASCHVMDQHRR